MESPLPSPQDSSDSDPTPSAFSELNTYACPNCGGEVQALPSHHPTSVFCPHCDHVMLIPSLEESASHNSDVRSASALEGELNANKIRQFSLTRRAAYRSLSYCIVGLIGCVTAAIQLLIRTVRYFRSEHPWTLYSILSLIATVGLLAMIPFFIKWTRACRREARPFRIEDPATPPDFSTLSDGSQHWKNLETMSAPPPENKSTEWKE
jgi:hypothetical protein